MRRLCAISDREEEKVADLKKKEKKGSAFANSPVVKAIGTQKLIALLALVVLYVVFGAINRSFWSLSLIHI